MTNQNSDISLEQQLRVAGRTRAAYLYERLPFSPTTAFPPMTLEREARATRRLERWRESFGPEQGVYQRWLEQVALSEEDLLRLLAEDEQQLGQRLVTSPSWLDLFFEALESQNEATERFSEAFLRELVEMPSSEAESVDTSSLLIVVEPFLHQAQMRLLNDLEALQAHASAPLLDGARFARSLLASLAVQLLGLIQRALILEFRIAQEQGQPLPGETTQEQLCSYARTLRERERVLSFFGDYPVLARQVALLSEQWHTTTSEMLTRLFQDWSEIQERFWPAQPPGALQQAQVQAGDRHKGGRSVQILFFTSGAGLVYKPRSLALDAHFQALLHWLNGQRQLPHLRILRILEREEYGWVEWVQVDPAGCTAVEEIERFYVRQGINLALLYTLNATDFHHENILAAGEDPVLIDLEALFHAQAASPHASLSSSEQRAYTYVAASVLHTLLLPARVPVGQERTWLEISGLGGAPGQLVPNYALHLNGQETNELRFAHDSVLTRGSQNRPRLHGEEVDAQVYLPQLIEGFTCTYRLLLLHRQALLAPDGLIARFREDSIRTVLRSTREYVEILMDSTHPSMLHDSLDLERLLNSLWQIVPGRARMAAVVASEQADLRQGDVPYFTTRVDARDLWTSSGESIPDFFTQSSFDALQERWQQLSEQDLARQIWFIRASFTTLSSETEPATRLALPGREETAAIISCAELLAAASQIGDRLCQLAIQESNEATWLGVDRPDVQPWMLNIADLSLYNGLPGIILALAYLGKITQCERYTGVARAGYATLSKQIEQRGSALTRVGFFQGWGGVIAVLTHLAELWNDETLLEEASHLVTRLPPLIEQDNLLDLLNGSAGCIMGLRCLASCAPSTQIDEVLRLCGERLATTAIAMPEGIGWTIRKDRPPLSGLSHGNAGIAWALLEVTRHTGEQHFHALARKALTYERSLFSPAENNWLDLRRIPAGTLTAWCHGAPGIGLARLHMLPEWEDEALQAEIQIALETTLAEGFGANHSLCHGDLGNLEFLYQAGQLLSSERWMAAYELSKISIYTRGQHSGWQCGTPQQVETPGLMLGLAGICLQLLRLAEPDRIPSLLSMDDPRNV